MIYLDNGATTPMDPRAAEAMTEYLTEHFGNASSLHRLGAASARAVAAARKTFADALSTKPDQIVFTGGGTEADNLGTRGAAFSAGPKRRHVLLFALEHPAVRNQRVWLEDRGFSVETIPCTPGGICDVTALERLLRDDTALVAVMHANNEIGTLQPLEAIGELVEDLAPHAHFHVDAVQSFSKAKVHPDRWRASSVALAGHKLHGPKGVGVLWVARSAKIRALHAGGGQERGIRPGTENVPGIVGFATAARIALENMATDVPRMTRLRDKLLDAALKLDGVRVNGSRTKRLCNNVNIDIADAKAEIMLHDLEERDVYVSSGSACHAGQTGPSHVLKAIGLTEKDTGSLRITLSRHTTEADIDACIAALPHAVRRGRGR